MASLKRTILAHEALVANTAPVNTLAVARAFVQASARGAVSASVAEFAEACGIVANTLVGAFAGAGRDRAVIAIPSSVTVASEVDAATGTGATVRALWD